VGMGIGLRAILGKLHVLAHSNAAFGSKQCTQVCFCLQPAVISQPIRQQEVGGDSDRMLTGGGGGESPCWPGRGPVRPHVHASPPTDTTLLVGNTQSSESSGSMADSWARMHT
jgi:hypothetical protein